jgi:hypothetical protein
MKIRLFLFLEDGKQSLPDAKKNALGFEKDESFLIDK